MIICNTEQTTDLNKEILIFDHTEYPQTLAQSLRYEIEPTDSITPLIQAKLIPENLKITSQEKKNDAGIYFDNKITFTIAQKSTAILQALTAAARTRVIALLNSTQYKTVIGNDYETMELTFKELFATKPTDIEGYTVTIKGRTISPILSEAGTSDTQVGCEWYVLEW